MQTITSQTMQLIKNGAEIVPSFTVEFLGNPSPYDLLASDIVEGSIEIDRNWVSGSVIEIGNAETTELKFSLDNYDRKFDAYFFAGAKVTAYALVNSEYIKLGVFIIDQQPKKSTTIDLYALDYMAKFNKYYSLSTLVYPATLYQILYDACSYCGVTLQTLSFLNESYVVYDKPTDQDLTFHQVVAWVAELAGANAYVDHNGYLRLEWYGESQGASAISIIDEDRYSFDAEESDIEITGIQAKVGDTSYSAGTSDYMLVIENNSLLQTDYQNVVNSINTKINGFIFRPFKINTTGFPMYWPGDILTITDPDGNTFESPIMKHIYSLNGLSSFEAVGQTAVEKGYASAAPFTARQKQIIQKLAETEAAGQVSALQQATLDLNDIVTNSMGYYRTEVINGGATETYIHDAPTLDGSTNIYTMTGSGFAWTDQGWNGGSPAWQYGYAANGNAILRVLTVIGLVADWIQAGSLRSANGKIDFNLDDETFKIGEHVLDILTGTLKFTSNQRDELVDYLFKRNAGDKVNVEIDGTLQIDESLTWVDCKAERRTDVNNEGVDFTF